MGCGSLLKNRNFIALWLRHVLGFGQFGFIIIFLGAGAFTGTILFGRYGQNVKRTKAISAGFILAGLALTL